LHRICFQVARMIGGTHQPGSWLKFYS
jgi:hypothetical protein